MNKQTEKVIQELAKSFLTAFRACLASDIGINPKTGKNTLVGSNLYKEADTSITVSNDAVVSLLINDYEVYVQNGRRSHKMPPIEPIISWAKRRGISTDNNTLWKIRKSIAEKGIKPRPFMTDIWGDMDSQMKEIYLDRIFNSILTDLNQFFNQ